MRRTFFCLLLLNLLSLQAFAWGAPLQKTKERISLDSSPTLKENSYEVKLQKIEEEKIMLQNQIVALDYSLQRATSDSQEKYRRLYEQKKTLSFLVSRFHLFCRQGFVWLLTRGFSFSSFIHGKVLLKQAIMAQEQKCLLLTQSFQEAQQDEKAMTHKQEEYKILLLQNKEQGEKLRKERLYHLQAFSQKFREKNCPYTMTLTLPAQGTLIDSSQKAKNTSQKIKIQTDYSTEVVAPTYGTVTYIGPLENSPQAVIIAHGEGYHSILYNLESVVVTLGKTLYPGEIVGKMAGYGKKRPILTFEFRGQEGALDPLPGLRRGGLS